MGLVGSQPLPACCVQGSQMLLPACCCLPKQLTVLFRELGLQSKVELVQCVWCCWCDSPTLPGCRLPVQHLLGCKGALSTRGSRSHGVLCCYADLQPVWPAQVENLWSGAALDVGTASICGAECWDTCCCLL